MAAAGSTGGDNDGEGDGVVVGLGDAAEALVATTEAGVDPTPPDELEPPVHPLITVVVAPNAARVRRM